MYPSQVHVPSNHVLGVIAFRDLTAKIFTIGPGRAPRVLEPCWKICIPLASAVSVDVFVSFLVTLYLWVCLWRVLKRS